MSRPRSADNVVVLGLAVVLAAVFLLTGLAKLVGFQPVMLAAAAMGGFPPWMRTLVGLAEVAGAIALLVPATRGFAAAALALLMVPAAFTQYASHQPGLWVPIVLCALLVFVAVRSYAAPIGESYRGFAAMPHPVLRDGVIAGIIGAAAIALWFFVVDLVAGHPLFTPATLGAGLLGLLGPSGSADSTATRVVVYTAFHVVAFIGVGLVASLIVHVARREPSILFGFLVLFVATEVGFYAFVGLLRQASPLGTLAWYQVMIGNLIAASAMGLYFWRTHRELGPQFRRSLDWESVGSRA